MRGEDDISAQNEAQEKGSRFSEKDEYKRRKKSIGCEESKGQEEVISLGHIICGLFFYFVDNFMKYSESLKKNGDFRNVYQAGKSRANRYLVMYVLANGTEENRVGISVSKKVGNSVIRHHLTRLIRESYRLNEEQFLFGFDIVVVVRGTARDISYREMESALLHLGGLHRILARGAFAK